MHRLRHRRTTIHPVARRASRVVAIAIAAALALTATACSTAPTRDTGATQGSPIRVAASINAWGSILSQLGGTHVDETSIITNPATDPHDYEPTPNDGKIIAASQLFVENGIGYDTWAAKSLAADPDPQRAVIDVGTLTHIPDGGNPHRWYSPTDVRLVVDAITTALQKLDPVDSSYFAARRRAFLSTGLAVYDRLIDEIRTRYAGTPVGASESIFAPLAQALHLDLITPPSFLKDISEGVDPSASDKETIDRQIAEKKIDVYVFNSQNATPDVAAQVSAARAKGIPVTTVTETLSPANDTFQAWQATQLEALAAALHRATGR